MSEKRGKVTELYEAAVRASGRQPTTRWPTDVLAALDAVAARPDRAALAAWVVGLEHDSVQAVIWALRGAIGDARERKSLQTVDTLRAILDGFEGAALSGATPKQNMEFCARLGCQGAMVSGLSGRQCSICGPCLTCGRWRTAELPTTPICAGHEGTDRLAKLTEAVLASLSPANHRKGACGPVILPAGKPPPHLRVGMKLLNALHSRIVTVQAINDDIVIGIASDGAEGEWWASQVLTWPLAEPFTVEGESC